MDRAEQPQCLRIIMLHRVIDESVDVVLSGHRAANLVLSVSNFKDLLRCLKSNWSVITFKDALRYLYHGGLPDRSIVLTFDDGYYDSYLNAFPLLKENGLPATFFVVGAPLIDRKFRWIDALYYIADKCENPYCEIALTDSHTSLFDLREEKDLAALKKCLRCSRLHKREDILHQIATEAGVTVLEEDADRLYMTADNVCEMRAACMGFGVHTMSHPDLAAIPRDEAWREIRDSFSCIAEVVGDLDLPFAYPFGGQDSYNEEVVKCLRSTQSICACTSIVGDNVPSTPLYELFRIPCEMFFSDGGGGV